MAVLFERHHKALYRFFVRLTGRAELSEDLVQDVFFRMIKFRHTYQVQSPFKAWMYQIARNAHIDAQRKQKWETTLPEEPLEGISRKETPLTLFALPDEQIRQEQESRLLRQAIAQLPVDKRELILMARFQDLKYDEIAQVLDCEVGTVKVRVHRAMKELGVKLRAALEAPGIKSRVEKRDV